MIVNLVYSQNNVEAWRNSNFSVMAGENKGEGTGSHLPGGETMGGHNGGGLLWSLWCFVTTTTYFLPLRRVREKMFAFYLGRAARGQSELSNHRFL